MQHRFAIVSSSISAFAIAAIAAAAPAAAQSVEAFYKGATVRVISSSGAGGSYDIYARLFAKHMTRHMPGNPSMIVQNMPGAGGIKASNYLYTVAAKDGSVLGSVHRTIPQAPILGVPGTQFDSSKFNWLGSLANEVSICASWHTSPVKTMQDAQKMELIVGGSGATDTEQFPTLLNATTGTKFKIISGYTNGPAIVMAVEKREVDGRCGWSYSSVVTQFPHFIKEKKINILTQMTLEKHPDLPDVPLATDFAKSPEDKQVMEFIFARQVMGRPYLTPPDVPADRLAALRAAFDAMVKDPATKTDFNTAKQELTPVGGDTIQRLIEASNKAPKQIIDRAKAATEGSD